MIKFFSLSFKYVSQGEGDVLSFHSPQPPACVFHVGGNNHIQWAFGGWGGQMCVCDHCFFQAPVRWTSTSHVLPVKDA